MQKTRLEKQLAIQTIEEDLTKCKVERESIMCNYRQLMIEVQRLKTKLESLQLENEQLRQKKLNSFKLQQSAINNFGHSCLTGQMNLSRPTERSVNNIDLSRSPINFAPSRINDARDDSSRNLSTEDERLLGDISERKN